MTFTEAKKGTPHTKCAALRRVTLRQRTMAPSEAVTVACLLQMASSEKITFALSNRGHIWKLFIVRIYKADAAS